MSTKLANVSQQDTATTSDQITAYMNAYGMDNNMEKLNAALDSWAEVANVSAADVGELATASQKAASTANTVGVNMDQLAAQIATIESVTREAPENIGNGLKTIYARLSDISMGETVEGVDLGQVTTTLEKIGVQVLNDRGEMRDVGIIMEDLMEVWDQMTQTEQTSVATTLAGKYQLSRFTSLMNRSDLYKEYKGASENASGTMDEMNEKYIDSLQGKLNGLQATAEDFLNTLFDSDSVYPFIDSLKEVVQLLADMTEAIGGGGTALTGLGSIATRVFSKQMAAGINNFIGNRKADALARENAGENAQLLLSSLGLEDLKSSKNASVIDYTTKGLGLSGIMSEEQRENFNANVKETVAFQNKVNANEEELERNAIATSAAYRLAGVDTDVATTARDKNGYLRVDTSEFAELANLDRDFIMKSAEVKKLDFGELLRPANLANEKVGELGSYIREIKAKGADFTASDSDFSEKVFDIITTEVNDLASKASLPDTARKKIVSASEELLDESLNSAGSIDKVSAAFERLQSILAEVTKSIRQASEGDISNIDEFQKQSDKSATDHTNLNFQKNKNEKELESLTFQAQINSVMQLAGALGQLAFTWQSFQSLGSLWANEDVDIGEKILQTFLNLSTTIPMVVSSLMEMNNLLQSGQLTNVIESLEEKGEKAGFSSGGTTVIASSGRNKDKNRKTLRSKSDETSNSLEKASKDTGASVKSLSLTTESFGKAATTSGIAAAGAATKIKMIGAASKFAAGALKLFVKAIPGIGLLSIALDVLGMAMTAVGANTEKAYNNAKEKAVSVTETLEQAEDQRKTFKSLYDEYKRTGEVTDELRETASNLANILGDQGLAAAVAADNFDQFNGILQNSIDKQKELAKNKLTNFLNNENKDSLNGNFLGIGNGSIYSDIKNAMTRYDSNSLGFDSTTNKDKEKVDIAEKEDSPAKAIAAARGVINRYNEELEVLKAEMKKYENSGDTDSSAYKHLKAKSESYMSEIEEMETVLNSDDIVDYLSSLGQLANLEAKDMQDDLSGLSNVEDIKNSYLNNEAVNDYLTTFDSWSEQLAWMIQNTTDETAKLALMLEQAQTSFGQGLYTKMEESNFVRDNLGEQLSEQISKQFSGNIFIDNDKIVDSLVGPIQDKLVESVIDSVNNSSLTDSEKEELMSNIDWSKSTNDILATVARAVETGNTSDSFVSKKDVEQDDTGEEAALKKYNIDENLVDTYTETIVATTDLADTQQKLRNKLSSTKKEFGENSDEAKEAKEELEAFDENSKDLAKDLIRTQKGLDHLSESFEENYDTLKKGDKTTLEYSEALSETKETMADILNVSSEDISNGFIEQNLDSIKALSEGSLTALNDLQQAFGQQYILDLNMQGNLTDENLAILQEDLNGLDLTDIEVGASVNDQAFIDDLNKMLASGEMTQEQVNTLLNGIGVEPHYTTEEVPTTLFTTEGMSISGNVLGRDFDIALPKFEISGMVEVPQIKPADSPDGGGMTRKASPSSDKSGISAPKGRKSGGGGGGSGGGKSSASKFKDIIKEEKDLYQDVNARLQEVANHYKRINSERERLTGFDMLDRMNEEITLLNKQVELHEKKLAIQKEEAQELKNELSSEFGLTFDDDGFIINYAQTYDRLLSKVNSLINEYNNTSSEEGQESLDKSIEEAQEKLDKFNEKYQRYDELWSGDLQETLNTLEDIKDQIEDMQIEAFNRRLDATENLYEIEKTWNEFNHTINGIGKNEDPVRNFNNALEDMRLHFDLANESANQLYDTLISRAKERLSSANITEKESEQLKEQIKNWENLKKTIGKGSFELGGTGYLDMLYNNAKLMKDQIAEFKETGRSSIFGENSDALYEAANQAFEALNNGVQEFASIYEDLEDAALETIEKTNEKIEDRRELYEEIEAELDHQLDLLKLIKGDAAYDDINTVLDAKINAYDQQLQEELTTLEELKKAAELIPDKESERFKALQEQIDATEESIRDLSSNAINAAVEKYQNAVNNIVNAWVNAPFQSSGMGDSILGSLEATLEEWELINRNADQYLDKVNSAYEIQKLQNKYLELLDGTNELSIQQKINEQMKEQLEGLREKDRLSQYDVAYANAQLEILQKRIALEEAQKNKSQMKLKRDSQGNYGYVYTANQDDIANAESDLLDAQNNAYNLSKEEMNRLQGDALSQLQNAKDLINNIWNDANITLEEKKRRTEIIINSLKEYLGNTSSQLSEVEKNIIQDFIDMTDIMADENNIHIQDIYDQMIEGNTNAFDLIDDRFNTSISDWLANFDKFELKTDEMVDSLINAFEEWKDSTDKIANNIGANFDNISESIKGSTDATDKLSSSTKDFYEILKESAGIFADQQQALNEYEKKINDIKNSHNAFVNELKQEIAAKEQENANLKAENEKLNSQMNGSAAGSGSGSGSGFGGSGYSQGDLAWGIAQAIWTYGGDSGWGNDPIRSSKLTGAYGADFAGEVQSIINANAWSGNLVNWDSDKFSSWNLLGYDTGGYTGTWTDGSPTANNGKLAFLHQKELVLNSDDTLNILKAVNAVRAMTENLKAGAFDAIVSKLQQNGSGVIDPNVGKQEIEQHVDINATFPNVKSADEVEAAILSLTEQAVQYAFRA